DSLRTLWAMAVLADGSVAIAGDRGRIDRWTPTGGIRPWARLAGGEVFCLLADGDGVVAGTGPQGLVYRVGSKGDTTRVVATGEKYVWALAPAGKGSWYAATGTKGRLLRIEVGKVRTLLDTEESNLISIAPDGAGGVYAGGDSKGRIVRMRADGRASTVFDATEDEVRALAVDPQGVLWAAALSASAVSGSTDDAEDGPGPSPSRAAVSGGRAVLYRIAPDSAAIAWWTSPQPMVYALAWRPDGVRVATGNRAGVFRIERANGASQLLAPAQGQVTALAVGRDGAVFAGTSNPASVYRLGPSAASRGELTQGVLDARRFARFGRLHWEGTGGADFSTRSGNTDVPDTTWSPWAALGSENRVRSPAARFLQWKLALHEADARVDQVSLAYREDNLPPRVEDLSVAMQGRDVRDGELGPRTEAVTQTLPGGQKVEYSVSLAANKGLRDLPVWARGLRTLTWRGVDPNGDPMRYRVLLQARGSEAWVEIGKDLEASLYTWNTTTIPDGSYLLKVVASDALGNAVGEEQLGEAVSEIFRVDNTSPQVTALNGTGRPGGVVMEGSATDAAGPLTRVEIAVDDGSWRTLAPEGGFADTSPLRFRTALNELTPGDHLVSVRAVDLAGNTGTRATTVRVPAKR
ncbi:MAG: hypothetical protein ABIU54_12715, partial [Candidatus Eisenbacteria bacterium]